MLCFDVFYFLHVDISSGRYVTNDIPDVETYQHMIVHRDLFRLEIRFYRHVMFVVI
jgi:hypothetical protein